MTEYTPDTDHIRTVYAVAILQDEAAKGVNITPKLRRDIEGWFDRWLDRALANAWDLGAVAGLENYGRRLVHAEPITNPYREDGD